MAGRTSSTLAPLTAVLFMAVLMTSRGSPAPTGSFDIKEFLQIRDLQGERGTETEDRLEAGASPSLFESQGSERGEEAKRTLTGSEGNEREGVEAREEEVYKVLVNKTAVEGKSRRIKRERRGNKRKDRRRDMNAKKNSMRPTKNKSRRKCKKDQSPGKKCVRKTRRKTRRKQENKGTNKKKTKEQNAAKRRGSWEDLPCTAVSLSSLTGSFCPIRLQDAPVVHRHSHTQDSAFINGLTSVVCPSFQANYKCKPLVLEESGFNITIACIAVKKREASIRPV